MGYCDKDIATSIGMVKKGMLELTKIWKDTAVPNKNPKVETVKHEFFQDHHTSQK